MGMKRMLLFASMALTAIMLAAPVVAQANVKLTDVDDKTVLEGEDLTATSTTLTTTLPLGRSQTCEKTTLHFEVEENGLDHVVLAPLGETTTEGCTLEIPGVGTFPVSVTDGTVLEDLTINTWGTIEPVTYRFTSHIPLLGLTNCTLEGDVHGEPIHETNIVPVGPSHLTSLGGSGQGCSPVGTIDGTFEFHDEDNEPIIVDFETTP